MPQALIFFVNVNSVSVTGFVFQNCNNNYANLPGVLIFSTLKSASLTNNTFRNNNSSASLSSVYIVNVNSTTIESCIFDSNNSPAGVGQLAIYSVNKDFKTDVNMY